MTTELEAIEKEIKELLKQKYEILQEQGDQAITQDFENTIKEHPFYKSAFAIFSIFAHVKDDPKREKQGDVQVEVGKDSVLDIMSKGSKNDLAEVFLSTNLGYLINNIKIEYDKKNNRNMIIVPEHVQHAFESLLYEVNNNQAPFEPKDVKETLKNFIALVSFYAENIKTDKGEEK